MYIFKYYIIFRSLLFFKVYWILNIKWYDCILEFWIDEIFLLVGEYEVKCVFLKCENWLFIVFEFKKVKVFLYYMYEDVDEDVNFFMKCICYGEKYFLKKLYKLCFLMVL